ncbi:hypothetical protein [Nostoc parmelioides]|uniref:Uncharacterized protein n=1 Tax=Nostoc parmelioides FACHB-3921 TaxID=2692909 RepID=A0ABR8BDM2_9NOSO|nr:hypothetical protein [Nostoc parmelioides]MBD2251958.1 hypothetical protein [Nostoc parmelioides FACHB-3921]
MTLKTNKSLAQHGRNKDSILEQHTAKIVDVLFAFCTSQLVSKPYVTKPRCSIIFF